jgi:hypothetical protein
VSARSSGDFSSSSEEQVGAPRRIVVLPHRIWKAMEEEATPRGDVENESEDEKASSKLEGNSKLAMTGCRIRYQHRYVGSV